MANTDVDIDPMSDILGFFVSRKKVKHKVEDIKDKGLDKVIEKLRKMNQE